MGAELVIDARNAVGESPVWLASEQALYWTDIEGRALWRWQSETHAAKRWTLPEMAGCIAPDADGGWIAGMESGVFRIELQGNAKAAWMPDQVRHDSEKIVIAGSTRNPGPHANEACCTQLISVHHPRPGMRFNDGRCDRQGRLRAGTMLMDMAAAMAIGTVYACEGTALKPLVEDLITPNGMAFSPDGRTMYLSDSHPVVQQVWAFDYDIDTGTPSNRRVFVDMRPLPGRPDGAAVDEDGCYWICANDAGMVHRFTPGGDLDRSITLPVKKPAMCAFGGARLDTLYVTSIRPRGDVSDQPLAGGLFAIRAGVRGIEEPECTSFSPSHNTTRG